jgi:NAD(P)-dependent dehydrogenase (short-subunit alcohol dehydrogenase family)
MMMDGVCVVVGDDVHVCMHIYICTLTYIYVCTNSAGATSGIGAEIARVLAKCGSRVIIPARNIKAANALRSSILLHAPDADVLVMSLDLSSLSSVRSFAQCFLSLHLPLNILMYNYIEQYLLQSSNILQRSSICAIKRLTRRKEGRKEEERKHIPINACF